MTRRTFLLSFTGLSASSCLIGSHWLTHLGFSQGSGKTVADIRRGLLGLFSDVETPRLLGKRYLELYPQEAQRALILATQIQAVQTRTSDELRQLLARKRECDFQNGEMVIVDGWLLARTEVEACALTVLL